MADTPWISAPWRIEGTSKEDVFEIVAGAQDDDGPEWYICRTYSGFAEGFAEAHAYLIESAPELAEAHDENAEDLRGLVDHLDGKIGRDDLHALETCLMRSLAMSAKARGEQ